MSKCYVLDTNIFNRIVDGDLKIEDLPSDGDLCASDEQIKEIGRTKCEARRQQLRDSFRKVEPQIRERTSYPYDHDGYDTGPYSKVGKHYKEIFDMLLAKHKPRKHESDSSDAIIGEISMTEKCTLISTDKDLIAIVKSLGGEVYLLP